MTSNLTQQDFLLALLSLDAYSRGGEGDARAIDFDSFTSDGRTNIGNASVDRNSTTVLPLSPVSGFGATSYNLNGETVIAYRGTDFNFETFEGIAEFLGDVIFGWLSSFNVFVSDTVDVSLPFLPFDIEFDTQPLIAQQFYEAVTGLSLFDDDPDQNVILTGHSLGGSLAGFVGSISGTETVVFNEIPFLGPALGAVTDENLDRADGNFENFLDFIFGQEADNEIQVSAPSTDSIRAIRTEGEIAENARDIGPFLGNFANAFTIFLDTLDLRLSGAGQDELSESDARANFDREVSQSISSIELSTTDFDRPNVLGGFAGLQSVDLHSIPLQAILIYTELNDHLVWRNLATEVASALFSEEVAAEAVPDNIGGYYTDNAKLLAGLAYSGLEGEGLVFGDVGIRAFFDDVEELGQLIEDNLSTEGVDSALAGLSELAVQFAGAAALRELARETLLNGDEEIVLDEVTVTVY